MSEVDDDDELGKSKLDVFVTSDELMLPTKFETESEEESYVDEFLEEQQITCQQKLRLVQALREIGLRADSDVDGELASRGVDAEQYCQENHVRVLATFKHSTDRGLHGNLLTEQDGVRYREVRVKVHDCVEHTTDTITQKIKDKTILEELRRIQLKEDNHVPKASRHFRNRGGAHGLAGATLPASPAETRSRETSLNRVNEVVGEEAGDLSALALQGQLSDQMDRVEERARDNQIRSIASKIKIWFAQKRKKI